jgi:predicted nucleic acid-binding protein
MKIFLDTSSLIKLYHDEAGTEYLDSIFNQFEISEIYLSELAKVEFNSAIWKKIRTKELSENEGIELISSFVDDHDKFTFIDLNNLMIDDARVLISKYGNKGLRTLDSLQLAAIVEIKANIDFAITSDKLLEKVIELEGIKIK